MLTDEPIIGRILSTAQMPFSYLAERGIKFSGPGMYVDDQGVVAKIELRRIAANPSQHIAPSDVFVRWYWPSEDDCGPNWQLAEYTEDSASVWLDYHHDARAMFIFPSSAPPSPPDSTPAALPEAAPPQPA